MLTTLISVRKTAACFMLPVLVSGLMRASLPLRADNPHSIGSTAATPIEHVVVIFQENVSFDHYFGTYPSAQNSAGEPRFIAADTTPTVNGLDEALLNANLNAANPKRLARSQAVTCDMDHGYTDEQKAFD